MSREDERYSCQDFCDFIALKVAKASSYPTSSGEHWRLGLRNVGHGIKQVIVFSRDLCLPSPPNTWEAASMLKDYIILKVDGGGMDINPIPARPVCSAANLLASIFVSMDAWDCGLYDDYGHEIFPAGTELVNLALEMDLIGWTPRSEKIV